MGEAERLRVGIDVGGTFTDIVGVGASGVTRGKVPSTPRNPAEGVVTACGLLAAELGIALPELLARVDRFGLGTTVVTNVLATRTGARLGLITTQGFEDLVPLARGNRVSEDGWLLLPPPLVERVHIVGVPERVNRDGVVLAAVDEAAVAVAAKQLVDVEQVDAVVVSLLWSFKNPLNERAVRAVVAAAHPGVTVILGSELAPVIREYERTQFALLNAYVGSALDWLDPLAARLGDAGLAVPIVLTHSSGGATTVAGRGRFRSASRSPAPRRVRPRPLSSRPSWTIRTWSPATSGARRSMSRSSLGVRRCAGRAGRCSGTGPRSRWSTSTPSAPAGARWRGWIRWARSGSARGRRAPTRAPRATAEAGRRPRSPTRSSCSAI